MVLSSILHDIWTVHTQFFTWRAIVEILFFSSLFYQFSLWLKKDINNHLLPYWFGYCLIGYAAYCLELPLMSSSLFLFSPVLMMLFIMMHQEQLQKNFVALRNITPAQKHTADWLEELIRSCITAMNNNASVICIIERTDNLSPFITTPFILNAEIHSPSCNMLIMNESYDQNKMIWIHEKGILKGINCSWHIQQEEIVRNTTTELPLWQQDALFFTTKLDAITFSIDPHNRNFTIISRGKTYKNIHAHNALVFIKKLLTTTEKGMVSYEATTKKSHHSQSHS